jgi:thioredoxin 1
VKNILNVSDADFDSLVVQSDLPALVDLWAEWCGPCQMIAPIVEEIAAQLDGKLRVFKLNTEYNPETPFRFEVMGIPTLLLFKNGQLVESIVGYQPKARLLAKIEPHLQGEQ